MKTKPNDRSTPDAGSPNAESRPRAGSDSKTVVGLLPNFKHGTRKR